MVVWFKYVKKISKNLNVLEKLSQFKTILLKQIRIKAKKIGFSIKIISYKVDI